MTNRIIKSLNCCKIILIFCILQVDFAISVITLVVIFNESFQKTLVYKSVCVINIVHLIVLSAIKNPLFDVYFNRITALLTGSLYPFMGAYLTSFTLFAVGFSVVMRAYLTSFTLPALVLVFFMFAKIFQIFRCSVFGHILNFVFHFYIKFFKRQELRIFQRIPLKYYSVSRLNTSCQRLIFRLEYH